MIGLYLLDRPEGKLAYNKNIVVNQTNFLPVKEISMETILGGEGNPFNPNGYVIMPSTYQSKVQGTFIVSVKCERPFELSPFKWICIDLSTIEYLQFFNKIYDIDF